MQAVIKSAAAPGFTLGTVDEPNPGAGEVLLRVVAASVCGTDVHLYDWNAWAAARVRPPRVMGHELCGEVVRLGPGVASAEVGRLYAVESHIVCHRCPECERGDFHVCANTRILGVDVDGAFAEYVVVPAGNLWPIGPDVSAEVAAAMEPFGNAVHACSVGDLRGATVVVFGCGPIGCACVAVARAEGAEKVVAVDRNPFRLELAERMGASSVVAVGSGPLEQEVRRAVGGPADCVLEMSGAPSAVVASTHVVRPGGWISLLGLGDDLVSLDLSTDVIMKGLSIFGITGRRLFATWEKTTDYLSRGVIDPSAIITHRMALSEIEQAITLIKSGRCGKVTLTPD